MSSVYFRSIWNTNNLFIKNGAINTPSYNTVDQNNLIADYGQILYNSTTNTVNFFSNTGTWNPIVPTNNITIGNLNFNNNTISSTTGDIILFPNSAVVKITGVLNMQTNNIINVGTINTLALPTSTFVGIDDSQVLTNKTINGSQLVNNSVSLAKMSTLTANTIIGNNTGVSATPIALDVSQVRSLLSVNLVENVSLSSWTGNNAITMVGNVASGNLVAGFGTINCGAITSDSITAKTTNLLLNGIGSNFANVATNNASFLVSSTVANQESFIGINGPTTTNNRHIACYQNGTYMCSFGLAGVQYFYVSDTVASLELFRVNMGGGNNCIRFPTYSTNGILRIDSSVVTVDSNFTTSTNNINCDSITAKTTNSNLTLNGNGTGTVNTNAPYIYIANNRIDTDTSITLDGTTVTKSRYVACYQNAVHKLGFGLAASSYFFIWDNVNARDLFQASIITGNIRFPTYSTNGVLRIDSGTVTVENNFTTSTNTINCNNISSNTTTLLLNGVGSIFANVTTNNSAFLVSSTVANQDSYVGIGGPTTTNGRYIACYQNGAFICKFGLSELSSFIVSDAVGGFTLLKINMSGGNNCIKFPTYSNNGILRIDGGTVTVDSNFTTGSNTINVDTIIAKTTNSNLYLHPNGTGTVLTNSPVIYIASNRVDSDSAFSIDGPTVTNSRYIACYQNGTYKLSFGLQASNNFFVYDPVNNRTMLQLDIGAANPVRFPTYTTDGTMSFSGTNGTVIRSSDRRLKENEELLNPTISLQKIMNLQPKKYNWISEPNRVKIGFIAQDVEISIPEAVDGKKFEYEFIRDDVGPGNPGTIRIDEEGKPVLDYNQPRHRGLDQCAILSVLVSAFQELHNSINIKLSSIENRLTALETVINVS